MAKKGAKYLTRQSPIKGCAVCLYRVGFGYTTIGNILCRNKALAKKWVKASGVPIRATRKSCKPNVTRPGFKAKIDPIKPDWQAFRIGDEQTHWWNHPEVARWNYNQNAEEIRARAKANYKSKWNTDTEWTEKRKQGRREWWHNNKEKAKAINKAWRQNNPDAWRNCQRRQKTKPKNKLADNFRRRVRDFVGKGLRIQSTSKLVGCSKDFLVQWIEGQFKRGMNWSNYGEWHVDHIVPCASFDLTDEGQQRLCFHYTNLRPLWAEDNMSKGAKIIAHQPELAMCI